MTMIKKLALAGTVAALGVATPAMADVYVAPSVNGTATVRLYDAITFDKVTDLDFGVVIRDSAYAGGASISMGSTGSTDCASVVGMSCTGSPTAATFTLKGDSGSDVSVSLGSADFDPVAKVLYLRNGADNLSLSLAWSGMSQDLDGAGDGTTNFSLVGTGSDQTISLYGDLAVKASSAAANGVYSSTFSLTADYK
ncbi:MAG: DUF4402 domain-containing protein [Sphingomicrobium sp.]